MAYTAEIIGVGTELLLGNIANTDAQDVSRALSEIGVNVYFHTVVGDNPERLKQAVAIARARADIIITTGGLGPTCDDLTKQTLAEAFGKKLIFNEDEAEQIRAFFKTRLHNMELTENNYQQAYLPEDCTIFHNGCGTAPGCAFESGGTHVLMLPGPPRECRAMLESCALPYLKKLSDAEIHSHNIHIFGLGESAVEARLRDMMLALENPTLAPYAKDSEVLLRVTARARSKEEAESMMAPVLEKVRAVLGDIIYGIDTETLENTAVGLLKEKNKTLSCAESCTGGLLAKRLTDIPGASRVFPGSITTYATETKTAILGVDAGLIREKGVASREVAEQMALQVREKFGSDLGVGITGIAGPDSDDSGLAPGTVFVALATPDGLWCRSLALPFDRARVRTAASSHALDMIRRHLTGLPVE
ncbi:nicotinamide-nucleotide amidase [Sporobacter termitidis DSM 10068]|uniref:Putative competence-damage inducible protein n=1 Tax=Sporobacter termitidis DSM 10068 TaxID=1123282 RepID=A0A1M5VM85_9FIRM|nr:competence/damage-inducible protein A [Sporobacter termitidis]SHH76337.1 nicotinamide-nucleotide amidase [Sporobacter termitidis DSM 10068]